jgi:hypothetical protein
MPHSKVDLLLVLPGDPHPVVAAKRLLKTLVEKHRMFEADAADKITIELVTEHFARYVTPPRKLRSFLDN